MILAVLGALEVSRIWGGGEGGVGPGSPDATPGIPTNPARSAKTVMNPKTDLISMEIFYGKARRESIAQRSGEGRDVGTVCAPPHPHH